MEKGKEKEFTFLSSDETLPPIYTNIIKVEVSLYDVVLKLGLSSMELGSKSKCKHLVDVYLSPQHAKSLARILIQQLTIYEANNGAIPSQTKPTEEEKHE